ncbi:hypothetical protein [Neorhizobium tomejilense]|uniref:hypothetical protein n=1 Tax=Neorhizobium tomejilense TaxID=2093828 RepID=UPI003ED1507C
MDAAEFLDSYDGNDDQPARSYYLGLVARVDADLSIVDELDHHDRSMLLREIAETLILAERIAYRFQSVHRKEIFAGAILIEDEGHLEQTLTLDGKVSSREDWKDHELPMVLAWLSEKYPMLDEYI